MQQFAAVLLRGTCTIGIKQLFASAAEHKLLPALVRVLPAFHQAERAINPPAIAVATSAFQAIDDAIGLAWRALEPAAQFSSRINTLGDQ